MKDNFKNINTIRMSYRLDELGRRKYQYLINEGTNEEFIYNTNGEHTKKYDIDYEYDYRNELKRVRFSDGTFGFKDFCGKILLDKFDVASDFNDFGYALVGNAGSIYYVDKELRQLTWGNSTLLNMPRKFKKLEATMNGKFNLSDLFQYYVFDGVNEETFNVYMDELNRSNGKTDEIMYDFKEYVNGYKIVKFKNKEYGYVRESDELIMPYRFDIVSDFNEYGLAMVGLNGTVTWINQDFKFLSAETGRLEFLRDLEKRKVLKNSIQFNVIEDFEGVIPVSRVSRKKIDKTEITVYVNTFGEVMDFYELDEEFLYTGKNIKYNIVSGTNFNEDGLAKVVTNDNQVYFLNHYGYCFSDQVLFKLSIKQINNKINEMHKGLSRVLNK